MSFLSWHSSSLHLAFLFGTRCIADEYRSYDPHSISPLHLTFLIGTHHMKLIISQSCTFMTQCVAVCCSVLQCVAVCCSVLQCVAVCAHCIAPSFYITVILTYNLYTYEAYTYVLIRMYVCMHVCIDEGMYACMHVCVYLCLHVCFDVCMHASCLHV